jgi:hypothetical protein
MSPGRLTKVAARTAGEVCGRYKPSRDAQKLLRDELPPLQFVERLLEAGQYVDAFDFLAHALPKREAVWWACLSVRHAQGAALPPREVAALKAAVEWVLQPGESQRRAAQAAGEAADFGTPAGCAALAVYGSGGSLTPPNLPEVPPEPYMTAQAAAGSITLASVQGGAETMLDVQRELVHLGLAIAEGKNTWPSPDQDRPPARTARKGP